MSVTYSAPRTTPARLTAPAAARLARPVLLTVCLVYIVFGLFLRDPWKTDDVIGLAQMWTAVYEGGDAWLLPQVAGVAASTNGPLAMWLGAISISLLGPWLGDVVAGRVPNLIWFAITTSSVWYGTYLLGRRPEAQPLALPFGGQPAPADYGRMLADAALLLLLATLGLAWRTHETSAVPAALACQALAFYSFARLFDRPYSGAFTLGLALAGAFLSRGFPALLPVLIAIPLVVPFAARAQWRAILTITLPLGLALIAVWLWPAHQRSLYWTHGWLHWHRETFGLITLHGAASTLRNAPWFLWPLWPLALIAAWQWRGWYGAVHLRVPLGVAFGAMITLVCITQPGEPELLALVVPAATLGALALPTLRRGQVNSLDWFAVMAFSVAALLIWFGWMTALTGWPETIASNIDRQTPGFQLPFNVWGFAGALLATIGWVALITWRVRVQPAALWRGSILSAGGVLITWVLLNTLWLPSIDYARSYRPVAAAIKTALAAEGSAACVRSRDLGLAQRASFAVFEGLRFSFDDSCPLVLQQTTKAMRLLSQPPGSIVLWEGARASDRVEHYLLLRMQ